MENKSPQSSPKREKFNRSMKITAIVLVSVMLTAALAAGIGFGVSTVIDRKLYAKYVFTAYDGSHGDRMYFFNTPDSDAILIESVTDDGERHYAMVDAGEDSDNPRGFINLTYAGYEDMVLQAVKDIAGDENGKVTLDFVVGTHAHSDHIGGFDTIILDEDVMVKRAYVKKYNADIVGSTEVNFWDNQEVYDQMLDACKARGVEVIQSEDELKKPFKLGDLNISFYNYEYKYGVKNMGENANSLVTLVEKDGVKALLTGDLNDWYGDETKVAKAVGRVDLLKVAHHGHIGSTSPYFVNKVKPKVAVVTQREAKVYMFVRAELRGVGCPIYGVHDHNGIIAEFAADGFRMMNGIHG